MHYVNQTGRRIDKDVTFPISSQEVSSQEFEKSVMRCNLSFRLDLKWLSSHNSMLRNSPRENFGSKRWLFGLEWEKRNILWHSEEYSSWMTPTGVLQISEKRREVSISLMAQGLTLIKNKKIIIVTSLGHGTQLLILKLKRRQARREGAATGVLAPPLPLPPGNRGPLFH